MRQSQGFRDGLRLSPFSRAGRSEQNEIGGHLSVLSLADQHGIFVSMQLQLSLDIEERITDNAYYDQQASR